MSSMPKGGADTSATTSEPFIQWAPRYRPETANEPDAQSFTTTREELKLLRMRIGQAKRLYRRTKEQYAICDAEINNTIAAGSMNVAYACVLLEHRGQFKRLQTLGERGERLFYMLDHLEADLAYLKQLPVLLPPNDEYPHR